MIRFQEEMVHLFFLQKEELKNESVKLLFKKILLYPTEI